MMTTSKEGSFCGDKLLIKLVQMKACNEIYLKYIEKLIEKLDEHIDRNRERQACVRRQIQRQQSLQSSSTSEKAASFIYIIPCLPPYFKDTNGMVPPWNNELWKMSQICTVNPLMGLERKWSAQELQLLQNSVVKSLKRDEILPLASKRDLLIEKLNVSHTGVRKATKVLWASQIKQIDNRIAYLRGRSDEQVLQANKSLDVDWDIISTADFDGSRSPTQLRLKWFLERSPNISAAAWTEEEDDALLRLLSVIPINWDHVADRLHTGRTAFQCFNRFRYLQQNEHKREVWTVEEDEELISLVVASTVRGNINWQRVVSKFPKKTKEQCSRRYKRSLDEKLGRGRWSVEDDLLLYVAVDKYGPQNWEQVAKHVRTRSSVQCRDRWINTLDPKRRNKPWIWEEHLRLFFGLKIFGKKNFSKIGLMLPGRNSVDVKSRVNALKTFKFLLFEAKQDGRQEPVYEIMPRNFFHIKSRREMVLSRFRERKIKASLANNTPDVGFGSFICGHSGSQTDYSEKKQQHMVEFGKLVSHSGHWREARKNPNEFGSEELDALINKLPVEMSKEVKKFLAESDIRYAAELEKEGACMDNVDKLIDFYESIMTVGRAKELQKHLEEVISIDKTDIARRIKYMEGWLKPVEFTEGEEEGGNEELPERRRVLKEYDYSCLLGN